VRARAHTNISTHARAHAQHTQTQAHTHEHTHNTHNTHTHTHTHTPTFTRRTLSRRCRNGLSKTIGYDTLLVIASGHLRGGFVGLSRHVVHSLPSGLDAG
jgi:hypothetical protein